MREYKNIAKERLLNGQMTFGFQIRAFREAEIARAIAAAGFHFAFIDLEHASLDVSDAAQLAIVLLEGGVTPLARIPEGEYGMAGRLLDGGVQGILVPHIGTHEQAREAVQNCKYRPVGDRWRGDASIHFGWGPHPGGGTLSAALNDVLMLAVAIESEEGVENIEEIASIDGVDVISVGSSDLAGAMGIGTDYSHPRLIKAWERVAAAARKHGKGLRLGGVKKPEDIIRTYELGSRMIMSGSDVATLVRGMNADLAVLQKSAQNYG